MDLSTFSFFLNINFYWNWIGNTDLKLRIWNNLFLSRAILVKNIQNYNFKDGKKQASQISHLYINIVCYYILNLQWQMEKSDLGLCYMWLLKSEIYHLKANWIFYMNINILFYETILNLLMCMIVWPFDWQYCNVIMGSFYNGVLIVS